MGRESDGIISLIYVGFERPNKGHLLKNRVSVRDSSIATLNNISKSWVASQIALSIQPLVTSAEKQGLQAG